MGRSGQDRLGEQEQGHVRPAPGTVDREEAQSGGRQAEEMAVGVGHQFVGLLGGGVERHRMVDVVVHRKRHPGVGAVDRTRRGIDQVLDPGVPAALEEIDKADQVGVDVGVRVDQGIADPGLGGQVHHRIKTVLVEQLCRWPLRSASSRLTWVKPLALGQGCHARLFQLRIIVVIEIVETDDLGPGRDQFAARDGRR